MLRKLLSCPNCRWQKSLSAADIAVRLRLIGQLRRDAEPEEAILEELLLDSAARMTCGGCRHVGLVVSDPPDDDEFDDWQSAVLCEVCRKPIPPERLEVAPEAKRCVACQQMSEAGTLPEEPDYCPKCGAILELRVSRGGGITRYKQFCTGLPPCRL